MGGAIVLHPRALDILQERVEAEITEETKRIAGGAAADWPDYKHRTGILKGLRMLEQFITELNENKER